MTPHLRPDNYYAIYAQAVDADRDDWFADVQLHLFTVRGNLKDGLTLLIRRHPGVRLTASVWDGGCCYWEREFARWMKTKAGAYAEREVRPSWVAAQIIAALRERNYLRDYKHMIELKQPWG